jgi:hypothetical protein
MTPESLQNQKEFFRKHGGLLPWSVICAEHDISARRARTTTYDTRRIGLSHHGLITGVGNRNGAFNVGLFARTHDLPTVCAVHPGSSVWLPLAGLPLTYVRNFVHSRRTTGSSAMDKSQLFAKKNFNSR